MQINFVQDETYVIFITEHDVMKGCKQIYHIERVIKEEGIDFGDGSHIMYVNGEYRDDTPLGQLMRDFSCSNPDDMYYQVLADRTRYFKEDKEGYKEMSGVVEEIRKDVMISAAWRMLEVGKLTLEEISQCSGLSMEEVIEIKEDYDSE